MEPLVSIKNVNHYYGAGPLRQQILFDVSADIFAGEIVIITGPSGSGKSTLLTLVGALRSVDEGSVKVLNHELRGASNQEMVRIRENIGFIFQAHNLLEALTARQNVQMALGVDPTLPVEQACTRSEDALRSVGLGQHLEKHPSKLSGGQRQRVAIARALVRRPKIVLADEPTAAVDRKTGREVMELIRHLAKEQGCAIVLVTHDNRILDIADRILTLDDGRITSFVEGLADQTGRLLSVFANLQRKGELVRHVDKMSAKQFLATLEQMTTEFDQFLSVTDLGNEQAVGALLDQILEAVTAKIRQLLNADRGTIFLVDRARGMLRSKIAESSGAQPLEIELPISTGIAGHVARAGQALNITEPRNHPDFNPEIERETGYVTRSILCMPIFDRQNHVFAVAQMINKHNGPFTADDEQAFLDFATPLGLILESCVRMAEAKTRPRVDPSYR